MNFRKASALLNIFFVPFYLWDFKDLNIFTLASLYLWLPLCGTEKTKLSMIGKSCQNEMIIKNKIFDMRPHLRHQDVIENLDDCMTFFMISLLHVLLLIKLASSILLQIRL